MTIPLIGALIFTTAALLLAIDSVRLARRAEAAAARAKAARQDAAASAARAEAAASQQREGQPPTT